MNYLLRFTKRGSCLIILTLIVFASTLLAQTTQSSNPPDPETVKTWAAAKVVSGATSAPVQIQPLVVAKDVRIDQFALGKARTIFVRSTSLLVKASTVEEKLRGRSEFTELGMLLTRDEVTADLILEVRHDLLTKYVYTAIDPRTQLVVASGKVSSLGGTVAGKVAKRFMKQVVRARASVR